MAGQTQAPSAPPRWTGDINKDMPAMVRWLNDYYQAAERYFATSGSDPGDLGALPDPGNTNLATAQKTANDAYTLAAGADARTRGWVCGSVSIAETDTFTAHTFSTAQEDADYHVVLSRVAESAPASGALEVATVDKTTLGFTVTFTTAPGAGNTVTWDFLVCRG